MTKAAKLYRLSDFAAGSILLSQPELTRLEWCLCAFLSKESEGKQLEQLMRPVADKVWAETWNMLTCLHVKLAVPLASDNFIAQDFLGMSLQMFTVFLLPCY